MAKRKKIYQKLPGRHFFLFGVRQLCQGPDHLLWVETFCGQEQYRRFYFKDIQAIIIQRTRRRQIWNIIWGALSLIFGGIVIAASGPAFVSGFLSAFFFLCFVINTFLGATCVVYLQTAVQFHKVTSFSRMRIAQKVTARLKAIVETEQGPLDLAHPPPVGTPMPRTGEKTRGHGNTTQTEMFRPLLHGLLFTTLLLTGGCGAAQFWFKHISLWFLTLALIAAALTLSVAVLVRTFRLVKGSWLSKMTWAALILSICHGIAMYVFYMITVIRHPDLAMNAWKLITVFFAVLMADHPVSQATRFGILAASLFIGITGLIALWKRK